MNGEVQKYSWSIKSPTDSKTILLLIALFGEKEKRREFRKDYMAAA